MKKILAIIFAVAITFSFGGVDIEASDSPTVLIDGEEVNFVQPPTIVNDRTLVEMRSLFEKLGMTVMWDGTFQTVKATNGETSVWLQIGNKTIVINGNVFEIDVAPQLIHNKTMVPIKFVAVATGAKVEWDGFTRTVKVLTNIGYVPVLLKGEQNRYDTLSSVYLYSNGLKIAVDEFRYIDEDKVKVGITLNNEGSNNIQIDDFWIKGVTEDGHNIKPLDMTNSGDISLIPNEVETVNLTFKKSDSVKYISLIGKNTEYEQVLVP